MSCEEGLSASEGYAMESPAVCLASEGYEMEPPDTNEHSSDDDDDYDCDSDCCDGLRKKKLKEFLITFLLLVLVCISLFLLMITGIFVTKYFEGDISLKTTSKCTNCSCCSS